MNSTVYFGYIVPFSAWNKLTPEQQEKYTTDYSVALIAADSIVIGEQCANIKSNNVLNKYTTWISAGWGYPSIDNMVKDFGEEMSMPTYILTVGGIQI